MLKTIDCNLDLDDKVKKRFPTLSHLSDAGILTDHERKIIEDVDAKCIQVQWILDIFASCFDATRQCQDWNLDQTLKTYLGQLIL